MRRPVRCRREYREAAYLITESGLVFDKAKASAARLEAFRAGASARLAQLDAEDGNCTGAESNIRDAKNILRQLRHRRADVLNGRR